MRQSLSTSASTEDPSTATPQIIPMQTINPTPVILPKTPQNPRKRVSPVRVDAKAAQMRHTRLQSEAHNTTHFVTAEPHELTTHTTSEILLLDNAQNTTGPQMSFGGKAKPKKRSFAAMMASMQMHQKDMIQQQITPPATPAATAGHSRAMIHSLSVTPSSSGTNTGGKPFSPQTVGSSMSFETAATGTSTLDDSTELLSATVTTQQLQQHDIASSPRGIMRTVIPQLKMTPKNGLTTILPSNESPIHSATTQDSNEDAFPLSPDSLTTPTSSGTQTQPNSAMFSPISSSSSTMTTPLSERENTSGLFSPQFSLDTESSFTTSTVTTPSTTSSSFMSPMSTLTMSSATTMDTPTIVTPTRPRSKSKRKLQRLNNLSIVVPPSENQSEEFRQGSLIITKEGIKQFEASPLDPTGSARKLWSGGQRVSTPSSLSTHNGAVTDEKKEDETDSSRKVALFNKHGIQVDNSIQLKDLRYVRELGRGASSVVSLMEHRPTGKLYAMKTLILDSERISPSMIYDEIEALTLAKDSSYIVNLVQAFYDKKQIHLLLEYIDGSSLEQLLIRRKQLPEYVLSLITSQILVALQFLHPKIMHMDIKPANILISASGRVYIADFGTMVKQKRLQDPDSIQRYSELGTVLFWPPERAQNMPFDYRSDIWNLGITLFVLRVGNLPFTYTNATTHFQIRDAIERLDIKEILKEYPHLISPEFADFLEKCLQKDPSKRATAEELQNHPFISTYKSVWTQNAGEDRVSNYLSIDEFHIDPSVHPKKEHIPDEQYNMTRTEEIIQRATQVSRENSPTDLAKSPELFSPSSSTPPSNTHIFFEVYGDSSKQVQLDYDPEAFNPRSKKKLYNRKHVGGSGSSGTHHSTPTSGSHSAGGHSEDKYKSPSSHEKSWKHNHGIDKPRSKSMYSNASASRRMASMDFDFDEVFDFHDISGAGEQQHHREVEEEYHVETPTYYSRQRSSSMRRPAPQYHQHASRTRSQSNASRAQYPLTPNDSNSRVVSSSYDEESMSSTPPRRFSSNQHRRTVMHSAQLERAQEFVTTHLQLGDFYTKKRQAKYQKLVKKLSKSDQEALARFLKQVEDDISIQSPSSWNAEKKLLFSPTFSRSIGSSPRDSFLKNSFRGVR